MLIISFSTYFFTFFMPESHSTANKRAIFAQQFGQLLSVAYKVKGNV